MRLRVSYHGVQRLTRNHHGHMVYGGSDLTRGARRLRCAAGHRAGAVRCGSRSTRPRCYHAAVDRMLPGFMASRINYDVAQGQ